MEPHGKLTYSGQGARPKSSRNTSAVTANTSAVTANTSAITANTSAITANTSTVTADTSMISAKTSSMLLTNTSMPMRNTSMNVSSEDNNYISDESDRSKRVTASNGNEHFQDIKDQQEVDFWDKLTSEREKENIDNMHRIHGCSEDKVKSSKGQLDKDSGYGDWLVQDLEVKGDFKKGQQVTEGGYVDIISHEVKGDEVKGDDLKGPVIDSGFEDVDSSVFNPRTGSADANTESSSVSDKFLKGINDICQNKHFDDHEQFLLQKWRESGLKLWKILHEREVCSKKRKPEKSPSTDASHSKICHSSRTCSLEPKMFSLEELAYKQAVGSSIIHNSLVSDPSEIEINHSSHNNVTSDPPEREAATLTLESKPEFWTLADKGLSPDESVKKSRFMEGLHFHSSRDAVKPSSSAEEHVLDATGHKDISKSNDFVEIQPLKEERYSNHKIKSSDLEIFEAHAKLWKNPVSPDKHQEDSVSAKPDNVPHIPFFCSGLDSCCSDKVWKEPRKDLEQKLSKGIQNHTSNTPSSSTDKITVKVVKRQSTSEKSVTDQDITYPHHLRRWSNIVGGDDTHTKKPQIFNQLQDEENNSDSYDDSIDLEFNDNSRPVVQTSLQSNTALSSSNQCNFKEHLLKSLEQHKSPTFSSDSATTDLERSSTNDWADADSSDPYASTHSPQNKRNSCPNTGYNRDSCMSKSCARYSPKRYRKKTHSRSRSMEHEVVIDLIRNRVMAGNGIDSDSTEESSIDVKTAFITKDQSHQKACKAHTLQAEHSNDTDSHDHTENYTVDSCSESSQSADGRCYTGCGPATGILGLRYAIPYLSERLKMSLAKRIESGNTGKRNSGKQLRSKSQGDINEHDTGIQSDPGCSPRAQLNDLDLGGESSVKTLEPGRSQNVSNMSDINAVHTSDRDDVSNKIGGFENVKSVSQHSNISNYIPNKLQNQGPYFLGQGHCVVKDRYLKGKYVCPASNDECSHDEISQTDESEGLEISHSFQYIDISDGEMETHLQTDLTTDSGSISQPQLSRPSTSHVTYDDICKSLQSHISITNKPQASQQSYVPLQEISSSDLHSCDTTTLQSNPISHHSYFPCMELSESDHPSFKTELSEPLSQINYLPSGEISESLKLIGQGDDTENCSCAETGFLSADCIDLEDVEENRADLQFLSIEQDTSDCSSIHSDTDRSNLSEELPVRSLFSTHSESDSGEADDEFECECEHCLQLRSRNDSTLRSQGQSHPHPSSSGLSVVEDEAQRHQRLPDGELEEGLYRISIAELSPLSSIMNTRRNELEFMFENVILQMLAVHPDLLSDATPPPADQSVIDALPSLTVNQGHLAISLSCPICLCVCEEKEILSCLPCQHLFHQLCIQAWLIKCGTCPVCRRTL
ncbi:uncharacterized protein LOC132554741 [Ylistrum balloti]|uniref:uncharacterized protein LOC132554741 n=1 Tax=Ylistrum balloti TaxID=509963 RepID=UPI002905D9B3|nr:uncharacterized protein LOC132554741 [Ylistrum balloti]